jgi:tetratricopeptide (TPR) repeat protein
MYPAAQICYANVLRINPKATAAWINMGVAHRESGQTERALQCYERALEVDPRSAVAWNNMGVLLTRTGDLKHALQCFNKSLEFEPGLQEAIYEREQVIALLEQKGRVRLEADDEF